MKASRNGVGKSKVLLKQTTFVKSLAHPPNRVNKTTDSEKPEAQDFINVLSFVGLLAVAGFAFGKDESKTGNRAGAQTTRLASGQRKIISFAGWHWQQVLVYVFSNFSFSGLHPPRLFS